MQTKSFLSSVAIGAVAVALAGAGGYLAHAGAQLGQPVNTPAVVAAGPPGASGSFADIIERVAPAVVSIDVEGKARPGPAATSGSDDGDGDGDSEGETPQIPPELRRLFPQLGQPPNAPRPKLQATGSGFFISRDGYIATNNHVVDGADKITVRTADGREMPAKLIGRDPATDLAVIKVEGDNYAYVSFEDRAKPRVGDWVVAVGNPFNLGGTATAGIVSALGRTNVSDSNYVDYMQIDAPINRGNSGGPTFDVYGRVVGVNTAIFSPSGGSVGIGFDIPADVAASVTKQLITSGSITRGYIGATIQTVTPDIAASLGLPKDKGALVAELSPGGPAEKAGLQPGDLVLKIGDHEVTSASDLTRQVGMARPGEAIHLTIRREGQVREVDIRSGLRPSEVALAEGRGGPGAAGGPAAEATSHVLGMRLAGNPDGGVSVKGVAPDSDAADKGLRAGDVILRAGDHNVVTPSDVSAAAAEALKSGRKDVLVMVSRDGHKLFLPLKVDADKG